MMNPKIMARMAGIEIGEKPHYNVVFATPGNAMSAGYVESLVKTLHWLGKQGLSYTLLNNYSSFVSSAREMTATGSEGQNWSAVELGGGQFTYDKVFWIDSDIAWGVEEFKTLFYSDKDIISGLYAVGGAGRVCATRFVEGKPTVMDSMTFELADGLVRVNGVGFGFVCMKQGVFEKVPRPWFEILKVPVEGADFPVNLSEDYSFCMKAEKAGFEIWVDPTVQVWHIKQVFVQIR
jgi:hypothetical protein